MVLLVVVIQQAIVAGRLTVLLRTWPVVQITASYLGGNAIDLEKTVAQPIEEQLSGLDGMLFFLSSSSNSGSITISVTFQLGTNPDTATVQTQNKVNLALPRLPPEVQRPPQDPRPAAP